MTELVYVGLFYLCVITSAIILTVLMVCVLDVWFGKHDRKCTNCGVDLPSDSVYCMCTVCRVGYQEEGILDDQQMDAGSGELDAFCQHTLNKPFIDEEVSHVND